MIWSTLHFIYVVFSVYLFFFLLPVIDIFLIDIHIMVLIYCFPDSGVDAVVRIEPSHGRKFFSVKKKHVAIFHIFPQKYLICILRVLFHV